MNKPRQLTNVWKLTYVVSAGNDQNSGLNGFLGLNTGIILLTMLPLILLLYGLSTVDPPALLFYGDQKTNNATLDEQLLERDTIIDNLRAQLLKAQDRMKKQADLHRREKEFAVGEWVFLKLRPYRQVTMAH